MTPRDFTYWLQGFVEITGDLTQPSAQQWQVIKDHLNLVFEKQTPDRNLEMLLETSGLSGDSDLSSLLAIHPGEGKRVAITC